MAGGVAGQSSTSREQWHFIVPTGSKRIYLALAYVLLAHALWNVAWRGSPPPPALSEPQGDAAVERYSPVTEHPDKSASLDAADLWEAMAGLVVPHGYHLTEHMVTTADGFVLRMYEIPCKTPPQGAASNATACTAGVAPVLIQHALMDSSAGFLLHGPGRALALQLADAGISVWLTNSRGNRYSRNHTRYSPLDPAFWAWSWQDMAEHDLPALVDHVLGHTGAAKLTFMGYSQGAMIGLAALSSQPVLAGRVSLAILVAPVAITRHVRSAPFVLSSMLYHDALIMAAGLTEWGSFQQSTAAAAPGQCLGPLRLCERFLALLCGANPRGNLRPSLLAALFRHMPAGTSVQNMAHWAQGIRRRSAASFHRFDFGRRCTSAGSTVQAAPSCNQEAYGTQDPPAYELGAITTPLALFTGGRDTLSTLQDVQLLQRQLRPGLVVAHHHVDDYAHLDWELGDDAPQRVYPHIVELALSA